jgi:hypothetical protein
MLDDSVLIPNDQPAEVNDGGDNFDENDPDNYSDIDTMMEMATGDVPSPGEAYNISDEVAEDSN